MHPIAEKALAAYGGREFWSNAKTIEAEVGGYDTRLSERITIPA